jgi:hypothetical protein
LEDISTRNIARCRICDNEFARVKIVFGEVVVSLVAPELYPIVHGKTEHIEPGALVADRGMQQLRALADQIHFETVMAPARQHPKILGAPVVENHIRFVDEYMGARYAFVLHHCEEAFFLVEDMCAFAPIAARSFRSHRIEDDYRLLLLAQSPRHGAR